MYLNSILRREARKNRIVEIITVDNRITPQGLHEKLQLEGYNISLSMLYQDLHLIRKEWKENRQKSLAQKADEELAILEHIRSQSLKSFEASKQERVDRKRVEKTGGRGSVVLGADGTLLANTEVTEEVTTKQAPAGDPRFLDTALSTSLQIRKLLGIEKDMIVVVDKQEKNDVNSNGTTIDDLRRLEPAELARKHEQALKEAGFIE